MKISPELRKVYEVKNEAVACNNCSCERKKECCKKYKKKGDHCKKCPKL